jgi:tRNA (guanine-N7-)-methyltransferase
VPWSKLFGREAPVHLEVGFGDGRFTSARARTAPEADFVGLEISGVSLRRAVARLRRERVANVRLLKVGAEFAVRHLFAPGSLHSLVVNFPDPWPKERHAERRLLRAPFYRLAASRLVPGGEIRLATDHPDYLAFAEGECRASELFEVVAPEPPPEVFETKYALKWRGQGKPLYYRVFRYGGAPVEHPTPLERPTTMPHALLAGTLPDRPAFEKRVVPYRGGHVVLHEVARALTDSGDRWLVRVTVDEPDLKQQLLVAVQRRDGGELIVRLEPFGDPIVTPAVRGAVHAVTEWLLELGGLELQVRNY